MDNISDSSYGMAMLGLGLSLGNGRSNIGSIGNEVHVGPTKPMSLPSLVSIADRFVEI